MRNHIQCGVYSITHVASGRIYIGSSRRIILRWNYHRNQLKLGTHDNPYLQKAWTKYGETAFIWEIEELVERPEDLLDREQVFIDKLQTCNRRKGFNIRPQANGYALSEETKRKISARAKGRKNPGVKKRFCYKLTPEDCVKILHRLAAWEPLTRIAKDFGVGVTTILNIGRRESGWDVPIDSEIEARIRARPKHRAGANDPDYRRPGTLVTEDQAREIKQRYRCGETPAQITRSIGLKFSTVYSITSGRTWVNII